MAKKKMGRPELPEGEAKGVIVQTRVSELERDALTNAAKAANVKLARWMRDTLLAAVQKTTRKK